MRLVSVNFRLIAHTLTGYDAVMCPDRKLKWFKDHGRTARQIKEIEKLVVARWNKDYAPDGAEPAFTEPIEVKPQFRPILTTLTSMCARSLRHGRDMHQ